MWAALDKAREEMIGATVERPAGSVTIIEYAAHYGITAAAASAKLSRMKESGKVAQAFAMIRRADGKLIRTAIYIPVAAPPEKNTRKCK
jgi:hypothetical protein